jgi:hypothetical protein
MKDLQIDRELIKATLREWQETRPASSPPPHLFHFTTCEGLCGILGSRKVWFSMATAMTDSSEVKYGVDLAASTIAEIPAREGFHDLTSRALKEPSRTGLTHTPFVLSLCANTRRAFHWQHYARSGTGAAIGFNMKELEELWWPFAKLVPVSYKRAEQEQRVRALIAGVHRVVDDLACEHPQRRERIQEQGAKYLALLIRNVSVELKDPCFEHEKEWRFILTRTYDLDRFPTGPQDAKYRDTNGRVVPYLEVDLAPKNARLPVFSVELGHSSPMMHDDAGLVPLVFSANPKATITRSSVPVRP